MGCLAGCGVSIAAIVLLVVFAGLGHFLFGNELVGVIIYLGLLFLLPQLHRRAFIGFAGGGSNVAYFDHGLMFKSIAISKDMGTVYLGSLFSRKSYGLENIRQWSVWWEQRRGMLTTRILRLTVADVDHAQWNVPFYSTRKPNRWVEILNQATERGDSQPQLGGQPYQSPSNAPPQLSPDGKWWWTGSEWVPAASRE